MAKKELVREKYGIAEKLLKSLDDYGVKVRTAFWWYSGDTEEWKLVLAMPDLDEHGSKHAYRLVAKALESASIRDVFLRDISL